MVAESIQRVDRRNGGVHWSCSLQGNSGRLCARGGGLEPGAVVGLRTPENHNPTRSAFSQQSENRRGRACA